MGGTEKRGPGIESRTLSRGRVPWAWAGGPFKAAVLWGLMAAGISCVAIRPYCTDEIFVSDAADYLRSARYGFWNTYFERSSVDIREFIMLYRDPKTGPHLWDYLYRNEDASALRHFHVPLSFYPSAAMSSATASNRSQRFVVASIGAITCGLIVILLIGLGLPGWIATALAAVIATSRPFVLTSTDLTPHPLFILLSVSFLFLWSAILKSERPPKAAPAAALLALSVATLEFAPALLITALFSVLLYRPSWAAMMDKKSALQFLLKSAAIFLVVCFIAWPGGFIQGGYFKSYGVFLAQALLRREEMFGPLTIGGIYERLFSSSSLFFGVAVASVAACLVMGTRRKWPAAALVFATHSIVMFLLNVGNRFHNWTYTCEVLVILLVTCVIALHSFALTSRASVRAATVAGGMVIMILAVVQNVQALSVRRAGLTQLSEVIRDLPQVVPVGRSVLVNRDHEALAAYLPQYRFEPTEQSDGIKPRLSGTDQGRCRYIVINDRKLSEAATREIQQHLVRVSYFSGDGFGIGIYRPSGCDELSTQAP